MSATRLLPLAFVTLAIAPVGAQPAVPTAPAVQPAGTSSPTDPAIVASAIAPAPLPPTAPAIDPALIAAIVDERLAARESVTWKDGFNLQTAKGDFKLKIGGYTQLDGRYFVADDGDKNVDQFTFRRIRPELAGTLLDRAEFRLLPDFAGGKVVVQDAYVEITAAAPLKLRFGKFKVPFGLERLQSATALVFVERALPTALVPNRDLGIQVSGEVARKRLTYQLGVFNGVADGASTDGDTSDDKELAARLFVTPFAPAKGSIFEQLGVGIAATLGDKAGTPAATELPTFKTAGQATFFAYRTGTAADDTALASGPEWRLTGQAHWYHGRFGVLAEYVHSTQDVKLGTAFTEVESDAWQVAANVIAIGGTTGWKGSSATNTFQPSQGHYGAIELAARYNELRLGDQAFTVAADPSKAARQARAFAVGANWILGRALRFVVDYERTTFKGGAVSGGNRAPENALLGRVQTVF